jgi:hypothetical protein
MSQIEKLKKRLASRPKDFTFDELRTLLCALGYKEEKMGKTAGSRVAFRDPLTGHPIRLHRPHPSPVIKSCYLREIVAELIKIGIIP